MHLKSLKWYAFMHQKTLVHALNMLLKFYEICKNMMFSGKYILFNKIWKFMPKISHFILFLKIKKHFSCHLFVLLSNMLINE